jgi:hypothetical protein
MFVPFGANPAIASYNTSVVKTYNVSTLLTVFSLKQTFLALQVPPFKLDPIPRLPNLQQPRQRCSRLERFIQTTII